MSGETSPMLPGKAAPQRPSAGEFVRCAGLATAVSLLLLCFFSPAWVAFRAWSRVPELFWLVIPVRRGLQVMAQVAEPFAEITDELHKIVQWRLLMPLVGHALGLAPEVVLALSPLGCVLVFALLVRLGRARGYSWGECACLAVVAGAGAWYFTSTGWLGYYDSWFALGLLTVAWVPNRWLFGLATVLTPWVDERFVIGFPLALFVRWLALTQERSMRELVRWLVRSAGPALTLLATYVVFRLWLTGRAGSPSVDDYGRLVEFFEVPPRHIAFGIWEGLRIGWVPVLAAVPFVFTRRARWVGIVLALGIAGLTLAGLATNNDLSRSAVLPLPVLPLGWEHLRVATPWKRARLAPLLTLAALLLPANHVVSTFTVPVHGLVRELQNLAEPPPPYAPELYLEEARLHASAGELRKAEERATVARRLALRTSPTGIRAGEFLRELRGRKGGER